jgi:hypothetical protein
MTLTGGHLKVLDVLGIVKYTWKKWLKLFLYIRNISMVQQSPVILLFYNTKKVISIVVGC